MFWRVAGFTQPSPVETLLDKDNFTLEELLDEDDIIQARAALTLGAVDACVDWGWERSACSSYRHQWKAGSKNCTFVVSRDKD